MAAIPRDWIDSYVESLTAVSDHMKEHLRLSLSSFDWDRPVAEVREELVAIFQVECRQGAGMASRLAAIFYDGIREWSIGEGMGALSSSDYADERVLEGAVHAIVDPLAKASEDEIGEASDKVLDDLCERLGMEVKRAAGETLYDNGRRDRRQPRFARVPRGSRSYPNGCPFCQMLATRGFVYLSEYEAGGDDPHHYHDNCRCAVVPSWDRSPSVEGYDPKAYQEGYQEWLDADHSEHEENVARLKNASRISVSDRIEANLSDDGWTNDIGYKEAEAVAHAVNDVYHRRFKGKGRCQFAYGDCVYSIEVHDFYSYTFYAKRQII